MKPTFPYHARSTAALLLALIGLTACSPAITRSDCEPGPDHSFSNRNFEQLGRGIVGYERGGVHTGIVRAQLIVNECADRQRLSVTYFYEVYPGNELGLDPVSEPNRRADALAILERLRNDRAATLSSALDQASELGLRSSLRAMDKQSCGCAAFYPRLGHPWPDGVYREAR